MINLNTNLINDEKEEFLDNKDFFTELGSDDTSDDFFFSYQANNDIDDPMRRLDKMIEETKASQFEKSISLLNTVKKEIGSDFILSGDPDNPIEVPIADLNDRQLIELLKYTYDTRKQEEESESEQDLLDEFEINLINAVRVNDIETVQKLLNIQSNINTDEYSDDDIMIWRLKEDYPDFTEEEIELELELLKESPLYEQKVKANRNYLSQLIENERLQAIEESQRKEYELIQQEAQNIREMINNVDTLYDFEIDDSTKKEISSLIFEKNGDVSQLVSQMDTPDGLIEVAASVVLVPKLRDYVLKLLNKIDQLENKKPESVVNKKPAIYNQQQKPQGRNQKQEIKEDYDYQNDNLFWREI